MNHYNAREIKKDGVGTGKWHFTQMRDKKIWPVGPCAEDCSGHDTPEEAAEHYRQYLISEAEYTIKFGNPVKCRVCGEPTKKGMQVGQSTYSLCRRHRNPHVLETVVSSPEGLISSW